MIDNLTLPHATDRISDVPKNIPFIEIKAKMYSPTSPVTSRSGYLRGRKRINVHPISQLSKKPMSENNQKIPDVDPEDSSIDLESSKYSTEAKQSTELESQGTSTDSGLETSQHIGDESRHSPPRTAKDPF